MNADSNNPYSKSLVKRSLFALSLVLGLFLVMFILTSLGLFMVETVSVNKLIRMNESIRSFGFWMQFIRWLSYLLLYIYWQPVIAFIGRFNNWDEVVINRAQMSRRSTIIIFLAVELFLIQSIHVPIYTLLMG